MGKIVELKSISELSLYESNLNVPEFSMEEFRNMYANPIAARIPIKIAYTIIQRLSNDY